MQANRRETFIIGATALLAGGGALAAPPGPPAPGPAGILRFFRIFATKAGESRLETVVVDASRKPLPVMGALTRTFAAGVEDWHHAPFKTFTINTVGRIEVELSDGSSQSIGPGDLVYLEDLSGKGHLTRLLTTGAALFLRMPDDFDVIEWARG